MLKFQLMTEKNRREATYIERRRIQEEERKKRLFNPKLRLIGIDTEALKSQVDQRKRLNLEEKRIDRIFEDQSKKADQIAVALDQKEKEERKKLQKEINDFRKNFQKPEDRREFDLNDPRYLKKQLPCRVDDEDPRLGLSSAQKFEGEDLVSDQRQKLQKKQFRAWLDQQLLEKEQAENERKMAELAYKAAVIAQDQRALELDNLEKVCRKKLDEAATRYNLALAEEKYKINSKKKQQTAEDNSAEIYNALTSDLLTENPEVSQSNMGPGKKIASLYKGMSDDEKLQIRQEQLLQIQETMKKKEYEKRMNKEFEDYLHGIHKSIHLMDLENQQKEREERRKIAEENMRLAEEQRSRNNFLNRVVYANRATEEYFEQFNKTTR
ncbi:RIB43A-like with coiled-coils protein 2 [Euwallacea similis]|uniref:RIB43A-like with coiled-coils protein 2 n=1 Tax=Euwallacea similis TaxID=1736056 RepID=UPI00344C86D9